MAMRIAAVVVLAALLSGSQAAVQVVRAPGSVQPDVLRTMEHPECTSIYRVTLEAKHSTQGNDLGMLPTHGRDTRIPSDDARYNHFNDQAGHAAKTLKIGADYRDEPAANDAAKQANARSQFSVTALTEPDATPMGFQRSNVHLHYAVCVSVTNTYNRWLEIMAESLQPDQQICVSDWNRPNLADNPYQTACGNGNLYTCRESPLETAGADGLNNLNEEVGFKFFCSENCDDPQYDIFWRITASQLTATRTTTDGGRTLWMQPDAENWCGMRDGDDYPSSLLDPYPDQYDAPAVFSLRSSASVTVTSVVTLAALAVVRALF